MATIPCKDCGKPVSLIASHCVHCRRFMPLSWLDDLLSIQGVCLVVVVISLAQCSGG